MNETAPSTDEESAGAGSIDSKLRFSDRVENYVRYRPGYPKEILTFLASWGVLQPDSVVADVGSGTGILSRMLLDRGHTVYGIEPNPEMRLAAEKLLRGYANFRSMGGAAEATSLPPESVDLVVAGQAFHWFDPRAARREFRRILRGDGLVALIWNRRKIAGSRFLEEYERLLLRFATDYQSVRHENIDTSCLNDFFENSTWRMSSFPNKQSFDFNGLRGRVLSSSYAPLPGTDGHDEMMLRLRELFDESSDAEGVHFEYDTEAYVGKIHAP